MIHSSGKSSEHLYNEGELLTSFDSSWDTFRTVHPLLSLTSPREWAEIVSAYVDGWRHTGKMSHRDPVLIFSSFLARVHS